MDETPPIVAGCCPKCGKKVIKTCKDYRCEGAMPTDKSCDFYISSLICNRRMSDNEISALLRGETLLLDGFSKNDGKIFSSTLHIDQSGQIVVNSKIAVCPRCGGAVYVGTKAFNCQNQMAPEKCPFVIWRNYSGHELSLADIQGLCANGVTPDEVTMLTEDGKQYHKRLMLSPEKDKIIKI